MPQDGLRSSLYRSFVTCDDPKGVITCRTIRKLKPNSSHKMENPIHKQISFAKTNPSRQQQQEEDDHITLHSPASFQLMEVSRGAQKLNNMIECWSRSVAHGSQPNDIAKDLLRGAIDLQDSLVMLGKLQEASRYMARLKRRQRHRRREPEEPSGFRRDRSSGEDLKRVIRESLVKQSSSGLNNSASDHSSPLSESPPKSKGPNLIAKLMGLEECPVVPLQAREARVDSEKRSLKEILETMQFKGLLRRDSSVGIGNGGLRSVDDEAQIVLIKPLRVSGVRPKESCRSAIEEEDPLYRRKMLRKLRRSEEVEPKMIVGNKEKVLKSDKVVKAKVLDKVNVSRPVKRDEKIPKVKVISKDLSEKDNVKSRVVSKSEDSGKRLLSNSKVRKIDSESNMVKNQNSRVRNLSSSRQTEQISQKKNNQKKEKLIKKTNSNPPPIQVACEKTVDHEVTIETTQDQLPKDESHEIEISIPEIEEIRGNNGQSSPSSPNLTRETDTEAFNTTTTLKALFTSSLSFQNRAEELFDLTTNPSTISQSPPPESLNITLEGSSAKLFLDCANELIQRKSLMDSLTSTRVCGLRQSVTLTRLVEEACEGIKALQSYGELAREKLPVECLYAMLERDMTWRGPANGIWDCGWRDGFAADDAEQVVNHVERLLLNGLIEEVFA